MSLSKEKIEEFKKILEKKAGREITWEEAEEGARNLMQFYSLMYDLAIKDQKTRRNWTSFRREFVLEGVGYTCFICGQGTPADGNWYDKWGIKCMVCQSAVDRKEISPSLAKNKKGWYSKWELERSFNLKGPVLRSWVKKGIIKSRRVTKDGRTYAELFLVKDNKDFLPPKSMVESRMIRVEKEDGSTWHRLEPWYRFADPAEHLKGYKILEHLEITNEPTTTA